MLSCVPETGKVAEFIQWGQAYFCAVEKRVFSSLPTHSRPSLVPRITDLKYVRTVLDMQAKLSISTNRVTYMCRRVSDQYKLQLSVSYCALSWDVEEKQYYMVIRIT